jgi:3,4-dihydroxy 2-butanone 4-phosphate synthase/GTP cyclohydrolase II
MQWIYDILSNSKKFREKFNRPLLTLSYAQSLDGSIAARRGIPINLSCPESLQLSHKLRSSHDAILVGIGTILSDDPKLNVRLVEGRSPQPIIMDSNLRFPVDSDILDNEMLPWVFTTKDADEKRKNLLEKAGVKIIYVKTDSEGQVDIQDMLKHLAKKDINSLMVEGGTSIITNMLRKDIIDLFVITITPLIIGGLHAVQDSLLPDDIKECNKKNLPKVNIEGFDFFGVDLVIWGTFIHRNKSKLTNIIDTVIKNGD